ncbi:hypothetical protein HOY80DRAFT_996606 [Tuber brumale]|nr:hypothetical protein HOY80DRAFT_996606 [Tuber brumale]
MPLRIPSLFHKGLHTRFPRPTFPLQSNHQPISDHRAMTTLPPMTKPTTPTPALSPNPTTSTTTHTSPTPFTPDPLDDPLLLGDYPTFSETSTSTDLHHLHVYSPRHNCHIAYTRPNGDCIISKSTGNLGIKGAAKGSFDAAFQLASHVLGKIAEMDAIPRNVELLLRDYGPGRDAFLKALMGREGQFLRGSIKRATDSTRLKFGGTRSRALRRL